MIIKGIDIKKFRKKSGYSQKDLAEILGVSYRTIQNYEAGGTIPKSKHAILRDLIFEKPIINLEKEVIAMVKENENHYERNKPLNVSETQKEVAINTWKQMLTDIKELINSIESEPPSSEKIQRLRKAQLTKLDLERDLEDLNK